MQRLHFLPCLRLWVRLTAHAIHLTTAGTSAERPAWLYVTDNTRPSKLYSLLA